MLDSGQSCLHGMLSEKNCYQIANPQIQRHGSLLCREVRYLHLSQKSGSVSK